MTTAVAKYSELGIVPQTAQDFNMTVPQKKYPMYLNLYGASSKICKTGAFPIGHFGVARGSDAPQDLGDSFDCLPLAFRAFAVDGNEGIRNYDPDSAEYKRIVAKVEVSRRNKTLDGYYEGPQFLLWVPAIGEMVTYHMNNASGQKEAANLARFLGQPATIKAKFTERKGFGWHHPITTKCSRDLKKIPVTPDNKQIIHDFQNPTATATVQEDGERVR